MKLQNGTNELEGYKIFPIDMEKFHNYFNECVNKHIKYLMGAKAPVNHLMDFPPEYTHIDCSGWARAVLAYATGGIVILPDGSCNENETLETLGLKLSAKANCANKDNHLRCCCHIANKLDDTGHIYFVLNGMTYESYGGHGVGSREWDAQLDGHTLNDLADYVWVLR